MLQKEIQVKDILTNNDNYNFLNCDQFKKLLFSA